MATSANQGQTSDIRVLVAGPDGKMGNAMMTGLPKQSGIQVVGGLRRDDPQAAELLSEADVLVDFTIADSAVPLILAAIDAGVRPVSGTSGLSEDDLSRIDAVARERRMPAVWASQMTVGGALMMHFCRLTSHFIDNVTVLEAHHATKADAPSGTAWELARRIREARGEDLADYPSQHQPVPGVLGGVEGGVRIHSMRMPDILGWNEVTFAGGGEVLSIKQTDGSRDAFPPFVARAVHEVMRTDRVGLIRGYGAVIGLAELAAAELGLDVSAPTSA